MGVVNATPDSFSDGGAYDPVAHGLALIAEGADWIDVGGESSRPGALPIVEAEEIARVIPVVAALRASGFGQISVDTVKPAVARAAIDAGAAMWNDIGALRKPGAKVLCAELSCQVVLMHMQGEPRGMQMVPRYDDVVAEVTDYLQARAEAVIEAGVARDRIWLDPGIGFGKALAHNLALLANLDRIVALGFPVVVGASRKGFIRALSPDAQKPTDRLGGSLAVALAAARAGVAMVRVHDVRQTRQALGVTEAITGG